ncbi:MAG: hypothetical protein ACYCPR_12085 [Thermoplasmataceae archaeon]
MAEDGSNVPLAPLAGALQSAFGALDGVLWHIRATLIGVPKAVEMVADWPNGPARMAHVGTIDVPTFSG